jgi:hypothetical protein
MTAPERLSYLRKIPVQTCCHKPCSSIKKLITSRSCFTPRLHGNTSVAVLSAGASKALQISLALSDGAAFTRSSSWTSCNAFIPSSRARPQPTWNRHLFQAMFAHLRRLRSVPSAPTTTARQFRSPLQTGTVSICPDRISPDKMAVSLPSHLIHGQEQPGQSNGCGCLYRSSPDKRFQFIDPL